jgi:hypothetical protein
MLSIRSSADMANALASLLDPDLRGLLTQRRDQLTDETGLDLSELVHIIAVGPGDTLDAVEAEAGVAISVNPIDGTKFGDRAFVPLFEYVERHGCWWEAVLILSDDGYGIVLFVPDRIDIDPALPRLIQTTTR